ncbi:hypothetical protein ES708_28768 [subsurface metagenome]
MGVTYVKVGHLTSGLDAAAAEEVKLGLGIDEAARILGVELIIRMAASPDAPSYFGFTDTALSFDPEDTEIRYGDDEQFAYLSTDAFVTNTYKSFVSAREIYLDYSRLNVITSRDLAFMVRGSNTMGHGRYVIFYEKYKPSVNDLNQLIAQRR